MVPWSARGGGCNLRAIRLSLFCGLLLAADPGSAAAQTQQIARVGPWQAYRTTSSDGVAICGISQFNNHLGLLIKHAHNDSTVYFELMNRNWRIPSDARARISAVIDGRTVLTATMRRSANHQDLLIYSFEGIDEGLTFVRQFADGLHMRIVFHDGDEGSWNVPLSGTQRVTAAFANCMIGLYRNAPTQPFGSGAGRPATRPFDPAPTVDRGERKDPPR
jgi:hypothetical protein